MGVLTEVVKPVRWSWWVVGFDAAEAAGHESLIGFAALLELLGVEHWLAGSGRDQRPERSCSTS